MRRVLVAVGLWAGCDAEPLADALWYCTRQIRPDEEDPEGRYHLATITGSDARCNDGSPPVLWIEPATDPAHARDFVLYLEGGDACHDQVSCEDRWCGRADIGGPHVMSSDWAAGRRSDPGLFADDPADALLGWNKVRLHYCSSDFWLGDAPDPVLLQSGSPHLTVWFQGHRVLLAQLDALDRGLASDDGLAEAGALEAAERVVVVGSSAGGVGATHHLDLVADRYPDAWVRGVIEGTSSIDRTLFSPERHLQMDRRLMVRWGFDEAIWEPWHEADCTDLVCADAFLLYTEAVTTPFVVRHDLRDQNFLETQAALGLSVVEAGELMAHTARRIAERRPDVSVLETNCGTHVVATDRDYFDLRVADAVAEGEALSLNDAVGWLLEEVPVVAVDTAPSTTSVCPRARLAR